jgi:mannose-6-phosphate isomerase-like protein (cupin superfamily)
MHAGGSCIRLPSDLHIVPTPQHSHPHALTLFCRYVCLPLACAPGAGLGATTPAKVASGHMDDAPDTQSLASAPEVIAPDGSVVRPLCRIAGPGSFAHFPLEPGETAKAAFHATVQEIWYIIGGRGMMWRLQEGCDPTTVELWPGVCLTIPLRTAFQFCANDAGGPLTVVAATMPPWPVHGEHRVRPERGPWTSALRHPHEE